MFRWFNGLRVALRSIVRRTRMEQELNDEIQFHLDRQIAEGLNAGLSPEEARYAALRAMGPIERSKEECRDIRSANVASDFLGDLRYAVRDLSRSPRFAGLAIVIMALGIGANTAVFSVVNAVLLRPLPYLEADHLVMLWERHPVTGRRNVTSIANFRDWQRLSRSFEAMAAFDRLPMNLLGGVEPVQVTGAAVTADFFTAFRVAPLLGRTFELNDETPGSTPVVVLTHGFWLRQFGGRVDVIGRRISVNATHHEVIGIMPAHFTFPDRRVQAFVPVRDGRSAGRSYSVVARLRPAIGVKAAADEMAMIADATASERPAMNANWSATAVSLHEEIVGEFRRPLIALFAAVGCLLLIACANVANLLLMRTAARAREFTVRLALGAGRWRLLRQVLVESLVIAMLGAALALGMAWLSIKALSGLAVLGVPQLDRISIDAGVLLFAIGVAAATTVLFGLGPALACSRSDNGHALSAANRSIVSRQRRLQGVMIVAEVALAIPLLAGAGLMVQSLYRLSRVEPGFRPEGVLTARMLLLPVRDRVFHAEFVTDALTNVRALPGVIAAGSIARLPLDGANTASWYYRADHPEPPHGLRPSGDISIVTHGYFAAMGISLLRGREFDDRDRIGTPHVAVLNETAVEKFFPGEDPIGKRMKVSWNDAKEVEIVGVVSDIRHTRLDRHPEPCLFMPNDQQPFPLSALVVRTQGNPRMLIEPVKRAIHSVDPDQGVGEIVTLNELVEDALAQRTAQTTLFALFGALALVLTCFGIYGVIAYAVTQRTRELGLRLALGATPRAAFSLMLSDGVRLIAIGLMIGLGIAAGLTQFMQTLLFEVRPLDAGVFASVTLGLMFVATAACVVPAVRAMRVDPVIVLRGE